ncbi:ribonuclease R [Caldicoprobacter algeriensis]|uniref:ribonuclease R n=1 Tax=Caldicoprobacter algeriensis TaxID=699281 RepID=UPI00207A6877|nr:ribonuclease R [Caldicoprobacter algeriensis]MCM8901573.1 ribonuclease R [Caldicoprobacter algeriensis]
MKIKDKIIEILGENNRPPMYIEQLMEVLGISPGEKRVLQSILDEMVKDGQIIQTKKKKYALPEKLGYIIGRIQGNPRGFGFLIPDDPAEEDVYISAENMNGAMHNDRVIVRLLPSVYGYPSREGEVYKVLERANKTIVGTFEGNGKGRHGFVVPDDPKIGMDIFVPSIEGVDVKTGYKVVVEIYKWPEQRRNPVGRIIEVLGHKDDAGVDVLSIIRQYKLPEKFPAEVEAAAAEVSQTVREEDMVGRKDFRHLRTFTIDGADARDFDDAVSLEIMDNGHFLLGVHIADVSHYVKEGSPIDKEAFLRGTSVYLVDRVIPMLPPELSNGICSLNPNEDRLAISVMMEIDEEGKVVDYQIYESVIRSKMRMIYEEVNRVLEDNDQELLPKYAEFLEDLRNMQRLSEILHRRRMRRGSIDFDLNEAKITLNEEGKVVDVRLYTRGVSERMIEEFMLICNETIAQHVFWRNIPFMYRIHEDPDIEKMLEFNEFIHNFGYHLKGIGGRIHPKTLQQLLEKIRGTREEAIINTVMLRSLQKARYSPDNTGHFGLAAEHYCHFTSPIRRYPDLVDHRIIKDMLHNRLDSARIANLESMLPDMAEHCSEREIVADEVEREVDDLKKAEFMLDKIGMEYDGIISGVTNYGIYVELGNTVEGLVHISTMDDDYYVYDEKHYCLIGQRTNKIYRLGDAVRVRVVGVDLASRNIDFVLVE